MDVREKLVELLNGIIDGGFKWHSYSYESGEQLNNDEIASHLIAHGVTVLAEDEAKNIYTVQQIEEIQNEAYDLGVDSVLRHKFGLSWDDAAELRTEIQRLQDAMKWISVKDGVPEHGDVVLCFMKFGEQRILQWDNVSKWWLGYGHGDDWQKADVTHWCCLPQPPKGE